ncbi:MAG: hypothetical protein P4M11_00150 [Candidatus Pacebacteria bacterium]|nr:hypothetical protein [Candidatus Paceibacterota bacterium]
MLEKQPYRRPTIDEVLASFGGAYKLPTSLDSANFARIRSTRQCDQGKKSHKAMLLDLEFKELKAQLSNPGLFDRAPGSGFLPGIRSRQSFMTHLDSLSVRRAAAGDKSRSISETRGRAKCIRVQPSVLEKSRGIAKMTEKEPVDMKKSRAAAHRKSRTALNALATIPARKTESPENPYVENNKLYSSRVQAQLQSRYMQNVRPRSRGKRVCDGLGKRESSFELGSLTKGRATEGGPMMRLRLPSRNGIGRAKSRGKV